MKVVLDLAKLHEEGRITQAEYDKFSKFALQETSSLAFNLLVSFGVIAVALATIALVPTPYTAMVIGVIVGAVGLSPLRQSVKWGLLAQICALIGALLVSAGIVWLMEGSTQSFALVTVLLAVVGIVIQRGLLIVLSVLALSATVGAGGGYEHAMYMIMIQQPTMTVVLFSLLAFITFWISRFLNEVYARLAILASRTALFLINLGFWVGSLWGDVIYAPRTSPDEILRPLFQVSAMTFTVAWAIALVVVGVWAAKEGRRWVVNMCAIFGAIHFYTQWFERLGATPLSVLIAGIIALLIAMGIRYLNKV